MSQISQKLKEATLLRQQARAHEENVHHAVLQYLKRITGLVDNTNYSGKQAIGKAFAPEVSYSYNQDTDLVTITYPLIVNEYGEYGRDNTLQLQSAVLDAYL